MYWFTPVVKDGPTKKTKPLETLPRLAEVVLVAAANAETVVLPAGINTILPDTSQSPAVKDTEVMLAGAPEDRETPLAELVWNSPTLPALALLLVLVPTIPAVWDGVMVLLAVIVVKEPARLLPVIAEFTIAVVAICVVLVVAEAVGAAGTPVKVGEANKA